MTYLRDAVVVQGVSAHVLDRLLARYLPGVLPALPAWMRAEVLAARDEIRRAALAFEATPVSVDGNAEMADAEMAPLWSEELIDAETAAVILGVTPRRMRQLGANGLGTKVGRVWMFDRRTVYAERQHRAEHE